MKNEVVARSWFFTGWRYPCGFVPKKGFFGLPFGELRRKVGYYLFDDGFRQTKSSCRLYHLLRGRSCACEDELMMILTRSMGLLSIREP